MKITDMKLIAKTRTLALSLAVLGSACLPMIGIVNPMRTQASDVPSNLIAQSSNPVTYITRFSWDPNQIVMQISEGEFIFHGYLFRTEGNMFVGEDDQVRVMYDYDTERVVVINKITGTEFYNYFFHDPNFGTGSAPASGSNEVSAAESNCLAAVANQTGVGDVSTIRVEYAESGIGVQVAVPGAEAPWQCVVDTDGETVVNVYYSGSEGAL